MSRSKPSKPRRHDDLPANTARPGKKTYEPDPKVKAPPKVKRDR